MNFMLGWASCLSETSQLCAMPKSSFPKDWVLTFLFGYIKAIKAWQSAVSETIYLDGDTACCRLWNTLNQQSLPSGLLETPQQVLNAGDSFSVEDLYPNKFFKKQEKSNILYTMLDWKSIQPSIPSPEVTAGQSQEENMEQVRCKMIQILGGSFFHKWIQSLFQSMSTFIIHSVLFQGDE